MVNKRVEKIKFLHENDELGFWDKWLENADPLDKETLDIISEDESVIDHPEYLEDQDEEGNIIEIVPEYEQPKAPKRVLKMPLRFYQLRKFPRVTKKEMILAISRMSGYSQSNVTDIIDLFEILFARHLAEGKEVYLQKVGKFFLIDAKKMPPLPPIQVKKDIESIVLTKAYFTKSMYLKKLAEKSRQRRMKIRERVDRLTLKKMHYEQLAKSIQNQNQDQNRSQE
jgi:nucleoid DNA-binding protein